jgi:hypothetical protein
MGPAAFFASVTDTGNTPGKDTPAPGLEVKCEQSAGP